MRWARAMIGFPTAGIIEADDQEGFVIMEFAA
jgi:hypothetical protein